MNQDLSKLAKKLKIKYFLISYIDFFGVLRSKLVPAQVIKEMQKDGAGFAGFATSNIFECSFYFSTFH